jgi:hypothetical protein
MLERVREMVLAADDMRDAQVGIIRARGQVIGRHAVGTQQSEIFNISSRL